MSTNSAAAIRIAPEIRRARIQPLRSNREGDTHTLGAPHFSGLTRSTGVTRRSLASAFRPRPIPQSKIDSGRLIRHHGCRDTGGWNEGQRIRAAGIIRATAHRERVRPCQQERLHINVLLR